MSVDDDDGIDDDDGVDYLGVDWGVDALAKDIEENPERHDVDGVEE